MNTTSKWLLCLLLAASASGADFPGIQAAIDAAEPGDVILVPPGRYAETVVLKDDILLVGAGAERTVIDGGGGDFVVTGARDAAIVGCTVQNGKIGIRNEGRFMGVHACVVTNNSQFGIFISGGSSLIDNNLIAGARTQAGIGSFSANPYIINNVISNNATGILIWQNYVPTVTNNFIVANDVGIRVGGEAAVILEGNIFYRNRRAAIEGFELSETDVVDPESLTGVVQLLPADLEAFMARMESVKREATMDHPVVFYDLRPDIGTFGVLTLFPWATFTVGSCTEDTIIADHTAMDLLTSAALNSELMLSQKRPAVAVRNPLAVAKQMDRYALDTIYVHPPSYRVTDSGRLIFKRQTNFSRIKILVPRGYTPVSVSHPMEIEQAGARTIVSITDIGNTFFEVEMAASTN